MKPLPKSGRLPIIESLRGWSATAVCVYHFVWGTVDYVQAPWARALSYWGQYGVTVFFVISSVVLPWSMLRRQYQMEDWWAFIKRRLYRLEPPYLASILLAVVVLWAKAQYHQEPYALDGYNLLLHLGYCIPFVEGETWVNPVYWSLAVEFQYYLLLSVVVVAWRQKEPWWRWLSWALLLSLSFCSSEKALIFRWLPLFVVGGSYVLWRWGLIQAVEAILLALVCMGLIGFQLGMAHVGAVLATLTLIHCYPNYNPRWSAILGAWSYSLYLVHLPVGQSLINVLSHHFKAGWQQGLVLGLGYGMSVGVAALLYYWVERPSQHWAKQVT